MSDEGTPTAADSGSGTQGAQGSTQGGQQQTDTGGQPQNATSSGQQNANQGGAQANQPDYQGDNKRLVDQINGLKSLTEPLRALGANDPDSIKALADKASRYDQLSQQGISLDDLHNMVSSRGQQSQGQEQPEYMTSESAKQIMNQLQTLARGEHENGVAQVRSSIDSIARELGGDEGVDIVKSDVEHALRMYAREHGTKYPDGHPLQGRLRPFTASQMSEVKSMAQEIIDRKVGYLTKRLGQQPDNQSAPQQGQQGQETPQTHSDGQKMSALERLNADMEARKQQFRTKLDARQQGV